MFPSHGMAQTCEEHLQPAQCYEVLGYVLIGLAFVVWIGGVVYVEVRRKRRKGKRDLRRCK